MDQFPMTQPSNLIAPPSAVGSCHHQGKRLNRRVTLRHVPIAPTECVLANSSRMHESSDSTGGLERRESQLEKPENLHRTNSALNHALWFHINSVFVLGMVPMYWDLRARRNTVHACAVRNKW